MFKRVLYIYQGNVKRNVQMKDNEISKIKTGTDYCKLIPKGGAELFISKYDYYLNKFSVPSFLETKKIDEIEKDFIIFNIKVIKTTMRDVVDNNLGLQTSEYLIISNEYYESLIYITQKLLLLTQEKEDSSKSNKKNLLVDGKKLNISERYEIANKIFNIYETANKKNISQTEKHVLVAHLLGCNQQTARELFNGTQLKRTPIREDIINSYLDKLK